MMKKFFPMMYLLLLFFTPAKRVIAEVPHQSVSDLPFSGYFLNTTEHAIEGLLFEDNQLYIYLNDHIDEETPGQEWSSFLKEFHSFPHPDLKNYSEAVRDVYLEENDLAYDLQVVYEEIATLITPEMSQGDIQQLINNRVPGIYYTEKNDHQYFTIARPTVSNEANIWQLSLFGEDLYRFEFKEGQASIKDQDGVVYDYISGIKP